MITDSLARAIDAVRNQLREAKSAVDQADTRINEARDQLRARQSEKDVWVSTRAGLQDALTLLEAEQAKRDVGTSLVPSLFPTV